MMAFCKAEIAAERIHGWPDSFNNGSSYPYLTYPEQQESHSVLHKSFETAILTVLALILFVRFKLKYEASNSNRLKSSKPGNKSRVVKARLILPFRLPIIDGIYNLIKFRIDGVKALEEVTKKFGTLYEIAIGPIDCIVVADPVIAQKVLCSSQPEHLNKPRQVYDKIFVDFFHDGLVSSEYNIWSPHRKMLSRSFTYKSLQHYLKFMNIHAKNLTKNLILAASKDDNSCVEQERMHHLIYCNAIKITAQIVMGKDKFTEEESAEFTHNFNSYKHLVLYRFMNPHLMIEPYWWFHPMKKEYDRLNGYLNTFFANITQLYRTEHENNKKNEEEAIITGKGGVENLNTGDHNDNCVGEKPFRCMIEEMLCCDATDKEIYDEVGTIMGTGHETTVVAIQMLLLHLALNPEHQAACREEMDNLINEKLSTNNDEFDCELSMDDLSNLKYLERCILESGRITPTVPTFIRRLDAPLIIDEDLVFPAGSNVAPIAWMLHRDPQQFPDPEKFDPDRFLSENVKTRHPYAYIPFSAGSRNCIGWKVALMEIKVIMAWILRHFEISSIDKLEDVKLLFEVTLLPERNYNITLKRRQF